MATEKQSAEKEVTVEEKLSRLYQLQTMVTEIDKIKTLRGELPLEVQDLEDEIAGLVLFLYEIETIRYVNNRIVSYSFYNYSILSGDSGSYFLNIRSNRIL